MRNPAGCETRKKLPISCYVEKAVRGKRSILSELGGLELNIFNPNPSSQHFHGSEEVTGKTFKVCLKERRGETSNGGVHQHLL